MGQRPAKVVARVLAGIQTSRPELWRRVQTHARFLASSEGHRALAGGLTRLDMVIGEAWRSVLTPRPDATGQPVGVSLTHAIIERAVVLWRNHRALAIHRPNQRR